MKGERSVRRFIVPFRLTARHVTLTEGLAHRVIHVLRMKIGDRAILCDSQGNEWVAEITKLEPNAVSLSLIEPFSSQTELTVSVTLMQGIPKGEKMDFIVQKATELGVQKIVPMFTKRTVVQLSPERARSKRERWQRVAISAVEQSGGKIVPEIALPVKFRQAVEEASRADLWLLFYEAADEPLREVLQHFKNANQVVVMVGPEGGFDPSEVSMAQKEGAKVVSLGKRILKTETAAIVAVALTLYELGALER